MEDKIQELTDALRKLSGGSSIFLSDAVNLELSTDGGTAATPKAVKTAYDKAVEALEAVANVKSTITITYWE